MPYDYNSHLWPNKLENFFRDHTQSAQLHSGPHGVSTSLAILTGSSPIDFQGVVKIQDPLSWSDKIQEWGMKLACCPTDARRIRYYMPELLAFDDLFTLSYYTTMDKEEILAEPKAVAGLRVRILSFSIAI
jgi:hypothetical protein